MFPVRLRLVPLLAGVDPTPRGTKHPKSDDHHQTDGDDDVHARPLFSKRTRKAKVKKLKSQRSLATRADQNALPMNGSMRPQ